MQRELVGKVVGLAVGWVLLVWRWLVGSHILNISGVEGSSAGGHHQHVKRVFTYPRENGVVLFKPEAPIRNWSRSVVVPKAPTN
jgi:hypothetical protein